MELDQAVRTFLSTKPDSGDPDAPIAQRRKTIHAGTDTVFGMFGRPVAAAHSERDVEIAVPGGRIRLRVYRPSGAAGRPIHVFLHGGGFWLGSVDEDVNQAMCRSRCAGVGAVVVAVDYRLAPEHLFPVPVEDCYAGLSWAVEHAAEIGGDPANVSIGGVSAGATLAAAVALLVRERRAAPLRLQLLEVPPLDLTLDGMRASGVGDDFGITVDEMALCRDLYLPAPDDARAPLASPLRAEDLAGLPSTKIMTAQFDPLRHDGERYAERLEAAGVPVSYSCYLGAVHGSLALTGTWPTARAWQEDLLQCLRDAHFPSHA
ncbi:acetyl esterase [Asanoa ferruginea]|uniref:Acetyl esterase n=1 Tax=Asanoa ferruginea TaxID=53367 RepID=A0A3D9ZPE7_9ACTN|nr:alpha/beta hydrolase [Asanoa ferruginea]REF99141.1 acetyl esterase [Asanoa ferruginea]GIF51414.1 putative lipase LipH [Asanoa ferruginea]